MTLIIILALFGALAVLAFVTRRRFGILGLGLAAGSLLAETQSSALRAAIEQNNLTSLPLGTNTLAIVALTLAPALLLMISGPRYHGPRGALIGAVLFGLFATFLLLGPLTADLTLADAATRDILSVVSRYENLIIAAAVTIAVVDVMMIHTFKPSVKAEKKGKG